MTTFLNCVRCFCVFCGFLITIFIGVTPTLASSVKIGDSKADVDQTLGAPVGRIVFDREETCTYQSATIVFVDGKAEKITLLTIEENKARKDKIEQDKVLEANRKKVDDQLREAEQEQSKTNEIKKLQAKQQAEDMRRSAIYDAKVIALIEYAIVANHMLPSSADALRSDFIASARKWAVDSAEVSEWNRDSYDWQRNHFEDIRSAKSYVSDLRYNDPIVKSMLYAFRRYDDRLSEGIQMKAEREQEQIKLLLLSRLFGNHSDSKLDQIQSTVSDIQFRQRGY